jgi:hypothetical protein
MTHIINFITVLQLLVHIVTIMLPLVDNNRMKMMMVVMIMMISTRH